MAKILWSVDEKKYNDKNAHTLILTGWAASTEKKPCSFILQGNGNVNENISIPEPFRFDRADVAGNFPESASQKSFPASQKICRFCNASSFFSS